jgi:hypothetical protein
VRFRDVPEDMLIRAGDECGHPPATKDQFCQQSAAEWQVITNLAKWVRYILIAWVVGGLLFICICKRFSISIDLALLGPSVFIVYGLVAIPEYGKTVLELLRVDRDRMSVPSRWLAQWVLGILFVVTLVLIIVWPCLF